MARRDLDDLAAFAVVAEEKSFTRAAGRLGTSQSALSQIIRRLEAGHGVKLLSRTTRSVGMTEAGERLLETIRPALAEIESGLEALNRFRDKPAGAVRITCSRHAAATVLWPAVDAVLAGYPDITIELSLDGALTNIVTDRFDAGVRLGEHVEKDMIAVRIGPDLRMLVVGSPGYFAANPRPRSPRDLMSHNCINIRMATRGDIYVWEFEKNGRAVNVRVDGRLTVNDSETAIKAAIAGHGLAFVMADGVTEALQSGALEMVLADWSPPFAGHHLYYPQRRNLTPAFRVFLNELKKCAQ